MLLIPYLIISPYDYNNYRTTIVLIKKIGVDKKKNKSGRENKKYE